MTVRVSVLLPVSDGEPYLQQAIDSILTQDLQDLELIVVDNGSTDGTAKILAAAARRDPRVRVATLPERDLVGALNLSLSMARADVVARMDADDICLASRLRRQLDHLTAHPDVVAVGCAANVIDQDGDALGVWQPPLRSAAVHSALRAGETALLHPTLVARKDAVLAAGGYGSGSFPAEDTHLLVRLTGVGPVMNLPEVLMTYRRHVAATSICERGAQLRKQEAVARWTDRYDLRLTPRAVYHLSCARFALRRGNRAMARKHARRCIGVSPGRAVPYAVLLAGLLPLAVLQRSGVLYETAGVKLAVPHQAMWEPDAGAPVRA